MVQGIPTFVVFFIISHLLIPMVLLFWILGDKSHCKFDWLTKIIVVILYCILLYYTGYWGYLGYNGYYIKYLCIALLPIVTLLSYSKIRTKPFWLRECLEDWKTPVFCLLVGTVLFFYNIMVLRGFFYQEEPIELSFPIKNGVYYVIQGGNSFILNNRYIDERSIIFGAGFAMKNALEFVEIPSFGLAEQFHSRIITYSKDSKDDDSGRMVHSPCDGVVTEILNRGREYEYPAWQYAGRGLSYIVIRHQGCNVLLAPLIGGSVIVKEGDLVRRGQPIAKVGSYLHIHATKGSVFYGDGIPILINGKFMVRNHLIKSELDDQREERD